MAAEVTPTAKQKGAALALAVVVLGIALGVPVGPEEAALVGSAAGVEVEPGQVDAAKTAIGVLAAAGAVVYAFGRSALSAIRSRLGR